MANIAPFFHQLLSLLAVYSNEFSKGVSVGWINFVHYHLSGYKSDDKITLSSQQFAFLISVALIGYLIGAIVSAILLNIIGRKFLLGTSTILNAIAWSIILFTNSLPFLYAARVIIGLSSGINDTSNAIYMGEITSSVNRNIFGYSVRIFYLVGYLFGAFITSRLSYNSGALIIFSTELVLVSSIILLVETPHFLIMRGNLQRAEKNFAWLNGVNSIEIVSDEFSKIKNNVYDEISENKMCCKSFTSRANYKSLFIVLKFAVLAESLGYGVVYFYDNEVFRFHVSPTLFMMIELIWILFSIFIIRWVNRKTILVISSFTICLTQLFISIVMYTELNEDIAPYVKISVFVAISLYFCCISVVLTEIFLARGELFPLSIKSFGNCSTLLCSHILSSFAASLSNIIAQKHGTFAIFLSHSINGLIMTFVTYFLIPERGNKTLLEIQDILLKKK